MVSQTVGETAKTTIRVMVVEDHPVTRAGLALFLETYDDLELAIQASTGEEAVEMCRQLPAGSRPDVILMDLKLPGIDGVATIRAIREMHPEARIIAFSSHDEQSVIKRAVQAGATSYLLKDISAQDLVEAIRSTHAGHSVLAPEATNALVESVRQQTELGYDLTEREKEVLELMAEGLSNKEIAERLAISGATVKFHVGGVMRKLEASSRAEVVMKVWQLHLLR
jgi:two-component system, NarL family, response regulator LiaR